MTMSDSARIDFLKTIGLGGSGSTLTAPAPSAPPAPAPAAVPAGLDPHTIPVDQIVFDPALLDGFRLDSSDLKAASDKVFALYRSPKGDPRNKALHRAVTSFITNTRRSRQTGGMVTEQVASTKQQRDLAALLAATGVTDTQLAAALQHIASTATTEA